MYDYDTIYAECIKLYPDMMDIIEYINVYTAPTATTARAFCRTLSLTAHGKCSVKRACLKWGMNFKLCKCIFS